MASGRLVALWWHGYAYPGWRGPSLIHVENLVKVFRRPKRVEGFLGGARTLFTRKYNTTRAVDGVSFDIAEGELVGYLGPNGAGKSTTIKMLTGILVPTSGTVDVAGLVPWKERQRNARQIGVVFGQRSQLWWDLPLRDSLRLIGVIYGLDEREYALTLGQFCELLEMDEFLDTPVRQLSLGQRMRGDLAAAMLYRPRVLYLDEPTVGLDVVAKERMRVFVEEVNARERTTVILTTHDMDDVERLCRRVVIIDQGRVLYDGDVKALKAAYAPGRQLICKLAEGAAVVAGPVAGGTVPKVGWLPRGAELTAATDGELRLRFDPAEVSAAEVVAAVMATCKLSDLSIIDPDLESVIRHIYEQPAKSAEETVRS